MPGSWMGVIALAIAVSYGSLALAAETTLLRKASPYNWIIVSEDEQGQRILRFEEGGARQTVVRPDDPDHLELPHSRIAPVALALVEQPKDVLVIGLGGGTLPSFLRKRYPAMHIDAVEIDPVVVEVAKSYFGFREDEHMQAFVEDGREFVERQTNAYDIVYLDAFGKDSVPHQLTTQEFLKSVKRALKPRGVAVGNIWGRKHNKLYDSMIRTYQSVYEDVSIVDVAGTDNKLVLACPWKREFTKRELVERSRALSRRLSLRTDLGFLVDQSWRTTGIDGATGRVLLDRDRLPAR